MNPRETYAAAVPPRTFIYTYIYTFVCACVSYINIRCMLFILMLQPRCKDSYILHLSSRYDFWLPENWSSARPPLFTAPPSTEKNNNAPGILTRSYFIKWFVCLAVGDGATQARGPKAVENQNYYPIGRDETDSFTDRRVIALVVFSYHSCCL